MPSYNPIQTNAMPTKDKLKNMAWKAVNATLFRFTPLLFNIQKMESVISKIFWRKSGLERISSSYSQD